MPWIEGSVQYITDKLIRAAVNQYYHISIKNVSLNNPRCTKYALYLGPQRPRVKNGLAGSFRGYSTPQFCDVKLQGPKYAS